MLVFLIIRLHFMKTYYSFILSFSHLLTIAFHIG